MTMEKSKFDKRKCLECKYHGMGSGGYPVKVGFYGKSINVFCNYAVANEQTCLRKTKDGVIDSRGDDYYNCKLYLKGKPEVEDEDKDYELNEGRDYIDVQEGEVQGGASVDIGTINSIQHRHDIGDTEGCRSL